MDYPKDEGTFNPDDSEDDAYAQAVIPETYIAKLNKDDNKMNIVAADLE